MLLFPTGLFSKPGFYYINIAKKCTKIHVFGKIAFWGWKNAFYPKTKVVPKTLSYCKMDKKIKFSKKNLSGVLGVHDYGYFGLFCQFWDPTDPPQNNIFWKLIFFICFTIAQSFWNNFCFGVKCIFLPQKDNFSKNMDFGAFFANIHIINALKFPAKGAEARICLK